MSEVPNPSPKEVSEGIGTTVGEKITHPLARTNNGLSIVGTDRNTGKHVAIPNLNPPFIVEGVSGIPPKQSPEVRARLVARAIKPSERLADPETGRYLNVTRMNWDKFGPDTPVTFYLNFLGNENDVRESRLRLEAIALQNPDMAFVAIDHPGHGGSDKLKGDQKSANPKDSYLAVADSMLRVAGTLGIDETNQLNLAGESLGAFGALALAHQAKEHGYKVGKLILFELPGVEDMGTVKIMQNQMGEFGLLDLAHGIHHDEELQHATFLDLPSKEKAKQDRSVQIHSVTHHHPIRYARMMGKNTAHDRLQMAMHTQPDMDVVLINGSDSTISPLSAVNPLVDRLRDELDPENTHPEQRKRIQQVIIPGEGHFAAANPDRLGSMMRVSLSPRARHTTEAPKAA